MAVLFQVDASSGKTYTYRHLSDRVERLAAGLQRFGVREGDVICMFSPNHIDYLTVYYASVIMNAVLQCINPLFTKGTCILFTAKIMLFLPFLPFFCLFCRFLSVFFFQKRYTASHPLRHAMSLSKDIFTGRKVLVIPRKRWLRPDMAEKLLTGTLSINTNKSFSSIFHKIY